MENVNKFYKQAKHLKYFLSLYSGMNQQIWLFKCIIKNLEYGKIQSGPAGIFIYDTEQNSPKKNPIFYKLTFSYLNTDKLNRS